MDDEQINAGINGLIQEQLVADDDGLTEMISDLMESQTGTWLEGLGPVPLLKQLKDILNMVPYIKPQPGNYRGIMDYVPKLPENFKRKLDAIALILGLY